MRKLFLLLSVALISISIISCSQPTKVKPTAETKKGEPQMNVTPITKADFLQKIYNFEASPNEWKFAGSRPVIVDFYATWCGPCKALAPIIEEIATEYKGKVDIYKVDVDQEEEIASVFNVRSIPTLLFVNKDGDPKLMQGAMPKNELKNIIDTELLK